MKLEPFDPSRLVKLAREQWPEEPWLAEALARCTAGEPESRAYIHFVDPNSPAWEFETTMMLTDRKKGDIVVDVLSGHRVGGVEFQRYL